MPLHEETELIQFRDPNQPNLHVVYWSRASTSQIENPKVFLWNHGICEHSARYRKFAETLLNRVPSLDAIISYDMRNHGKSDGTKGATKQLSEFVDDLYNHILPHAALRYGANSSVVVGGHSMGGVIVASAMTRKDCLLADAFGKLNGVILSAPAIEVIVSGVLNKVLQPVAPYLCRIPGSRGLTKGVGIRPSDLCKNEEAVDAYVKDPLVHDKVSVGVGTDLLSYGNTVLEAVKSEPECVLNTVPVLVLHGGDDKVVRMEGSEKLVSTVNMKGVAKLVKIDGAFHETFNEKPDVGSDKFFESVAEFLASVFS
ncbi:lysophospholipase [Gracilaria domingensis]|nr:lysophospholipase [Gracilaria domingensis]